MNRILYFAFALSGMTGLMYEVIWIRLFKISFGSTTLTLTLIFVALLVGLTLGSFLMGRLKTNNEGVVLFLFQIAIAVLGIGITLVANNIFIHSLFAKYVILFLLVIVPATLFGGMWPLVHKIKIGDIEKVGKESGILFSYNSIAAGIGVLLTAFLLFPMYGILGAVSFACLLNVVSALIFLREGRHC